MDVLLKITGIARSDTEDVTESLVRGSYYCKDGDIYIFYEGVDEETPQLITRHRIVIRGNTAEIQRTGAIQSKMIIVPGELNQCNYATPYGVLQLDFYGIAVEAEADETGVRIRLNYEIRISDVPVSENELLIETSAEE
ncbi:MAG: DUF1934 domain-containing protein [Lachnospiraceae bacterium]|nr:DUF1934 domain-containing protein [Lachnospiraceae bacterium]